MDVPEIEYSLPGGELPATGERAPSAVVGSAFFEVQLDLFDGPIDLLLHLVKQNELPIEKISLAQVTSQYLKCIEQMKYYDLEVAGEYLVIAATLVSIKSSVLLNEPVELVADEYGNLVDPHHQLLLRLREAAIYRDGAKALDQRDWLGVDVFESRIGLEGIEPPPVRYKPHDAMLLARAFRKILHKLENEQPGFTITVEHVSIVERMRVMLEQLEGSDTRLSFSDILLGPGKGSMSGVTRGGVVASFVAILELCKRQIVLVTQDEVFDEIFISLAARAGEGVERAERPSFDTLSSEFDEDIETSDNEKSEEVVNN